jgi:uncharacterized membrane protein/LysM repeat protein
VTGVLGRGTDPKQPTTEQGTPNVVAQSNFSQNYQPITASFPAAAFGQYSVRGGDTLQSIAQAVYGDSAMWYVVAEANGLTDDRDLRGGQNQTVPSRPFGTHNTSSTFKPYNPAEIIGSTSPNLPAPVPKKDKCGIVKLILVVVVAAVVTAYTGGLAAAALGPLLGAAVGAAAGSIASQLVGMALKTNDGFSWKEVGMAALTGIATAGVGAAMGGAAKWASELNGLGKVLAQTAVEGTKAALNSAASQGLRILLTKDDHWSWREVASAAARPPV